MKSGNIFINNPYLAMVLAILIVLCGALAILKMPLAQYPDVTPPQITVSIVYPGADAQTLLDSVVAPLEQQINGVSGLIYLQSTTSDSGSALITATFAIGTDAEINRQNVQQRVDWANPQLPQAVQKEGIIVRQQNGNILLGISLYSPDKTYDSLFMSNYADINLVNPLARIDGVSQVELFGSGNYSMRIWLDSAKCAALKLPLESVILALQNQNIQVSSGGVGQSPQGVVQKFAYNVKVQGRLLKPAEFGNIIVRSEPGGAQVKLADVAEITLGAESYSDSAALNLAPAVMLLVFQNSGANGLQIDTECRALMKKLSADFPPNLEYGFQYDSTNFVRSGIKNVIFTLLIAVGLVAGVSLLFLQDWRMMLIPVLAIPVSIVGTFAVLQMIGFSINMITLFALTLAIGIVVDDAIIVIENVSRLMDEEKLPPMEAAAKSMKQITGAIIATTAVLLAMFVPLCFFPGITGKLYREFGVTLSIAVLISAFNALSLSPALSGLILREHDENHGSDFWFFRLFNRGFGKLSQGAAWTLKHMLKFGVVIAVLYLLGAGAVFYWYSQRPAGFIPVEDQGYFFGSIQLRADAPLPITRMANQEIVKLIKHLPGVADVISIPGFNVLNSTPEANDIFVVVILRPWSERAKAGLSSGKIMKMLQYESLINIPDGFCMYFQPPAIPGIGMAGGFNLVLEQRGYSDPVELADVVRKILFAAMSNHKLSNVFSAYNADTPSIFLKINREKALSLGVSMADLDNVLQNELGYTFINQFNRFGQVYKVEIQAQSGFRSGIDDILRLHVVNSHGEMVPLASIAETVIDFAPGYLSRHNLHMAAQIQGGVAPGVSSSEAMREIAMITAGQMAENMAFEWTDMSYQEANAGDKGPWILLLAIIFIFLFLAALYQSWLLPFSVIPVIALAMGGALLTLSWAEINNNIYSQIGLILLFGMACKTAILVVDFAKQRCSENYSAFEAATYAEKLRFRAVFMTSFAFIFGSMPLALATGPGAAGQTSIGIPVVGGMIGALLGGILFAPTFFFLLAKILNVVKKKTAVEILIFCGLLGIFCGCYTPPAGGTLIDALDTESAIKIARIPPFEVECLSRSQAVKLALENNPDYRTALLAINNAKMRYYQALGSYSPDIAAGGGFGQQIFSGGLPQNYGGNSASNSFYLYGTVQANLLLFDGFARELEWMIAKNQIKQQELLSENAKLILQQAVLTAYDEILLAVEQTRIARSNMEFQREELRQAGLKVKAGSAPELDVLSFTGQYQEAEITFVKAENRERIGRYSLSLLLGYPQSSWAQQIKLAGDFDLLTEPYVMELEFYLNEAVAHRPDLNAVRVNLTAQKYKHYQSYSKYSPQFMATASYSYSNVDSFNSGNMGSYLVNGGFFNYGGFAVWNIFDGFRRYNKIRETRITLDQAYLAGSALWLRAVNEVQSSHADTVNAVQLVKLATLRRDTLRRERDMVKKEYYSGNAELIRFQQAQNNYINSEYELLESKINQRKFWVKLLTAAAQESALTDLESSGK